MREPYQTIWNSYVYSVTGLPNLNIWNWNVKYTGDAFYIGTNDDHITILKSNDGFHHSINGPGGHDTGRQHTTATSLDKIIEHIKANSQFYNEPKILKTIEYINSKMKVAI